MLPSHLDPKGNRDGRQSNTRLGQAPPPPMPSLCVTGAMSRVGRYEPSPGVSLAYCIFRPRQLHDEERPPLVVCHGGPSVPSNYLLPIVNGVTDRTIIFYDQWGCGKSSRPSPTTAIKFSIDTMVEHLELLIKNHWKLSSFHLCGHSFGGVLAFEFLLKASAEGTGCRSLILASTPTSSQLILEESKRLYRQVNDLSEEQDDQGEDDVTRQKRSLVFRQTHECRLDHVPLALMDAMAQAGPPSWRGLPAILDYCATGQVTNIPTLLLRGEYDFATTETMKGWNDLVSEPSPQEKVLLNCSHYGMLEDEQQYGKALSEFIQGQEKK